MTRSVHHIPILFAIFSSLYYIGTCNSSIDRLIIENGILWNISNHRVDRFNVIYRLNNCRFNLFFSSYSVKCFKSLSIERSMLLDRKVAVST